MDASIIDAPSSTKNATGERDPEMHQTQKGNQWYHGMKARRGRGDGAGARPGDDGGGTLRMLAFMTALFSEPEANLIGVEEPRWFV